MLLHWNRGCSQGVSVCRWTVQVGWNTVQEAHSENSIAVFMYFRNPLKVDQYPDAEFRVMRPLRLSFLAVSRYSRNLLQRSMSISSKVHLPCTKLLCLCQSEKQTRTEFQRGNDRESRSHPLPQVRVSCQWTVWLLWQVQTQGRLLGALSQATP